MLLVEVWIPETDKLWSRSTETQNLPASWTALTGGEDRLWREILIFNIFQYVFRFVLKGVSYNPMDVMNCLMIRRGYKMQGNPQQRSLPNVHNKDDK